MKMGHGLFIMLVPGSIIGIVYEMIKEVVY
jgi:hypothetical protein